MRVAVFGAHGFVGSAVMAGFCALGVEPIGIARGEALREPVDVLVNAACPSRRLDAQKDPAWDFAESVEKSAHLFRHDAGLFLQVSSLSARYPNNSVYGYHRLLAERAVASSRTLVCRLGPMYGAGLRKGVLVDMLAGTPVYADPATRYSYADVAWVGRRVASLAKHTGLCDVGGRGWLELGEIARSIGSSSEFRPSDYLPIREDQVTEDEDAPDSRLVLDWLAAQIPEVLPA